MEMKRKKRIAVLLSACLVLAFALAGCGSEEETTPAAETSAAEVTTADVTTTAETATTAPAASSDEIMLAAAASLKNVFEDELIPMFTAKTGIAVTATYDSSGKLQTQIEEGAEVDVFFSAAAKQMTALSEQSMVDTASVVNLLENKLVMIVPSDKAADYTSFEDVLKADTVAIGDPESVPAGQYAKEALENLNLWEELQSKTVSLGTNVTEVLQWVAAGSADAGFVYQTDAVSQADAVTIVAEAPEGSLQTPVIYPVGILTEAKNPNGAAQFLEFLQSDEALAVFEEYGFTAIK